MILSFRLALMCDNDALVFLPQRAACWWSQWSVGTIRCQLVPQDGAKAFVHTTIQTYL